MAQKAYKQIGLRIPADDFNRVASLAGERGMSRYCLNAVLTFTDHLEKTLESVGSNEQCRN